MFGVGEKIWGECKVSDDFKLGLVVLMVSGVDLASKCVFSVVVLWEGVDGEGKFMFMSPKM